MKFTGFRCDRCKNAFLEQVPTATVERQGKRYQLCSQCDREHGEFLNGRDSERGSDGPLAPVTSSRPAAKERAQTLRASETG